MRAAAPIEGPQAIPEKKPQTLSGPDAPRPMFMGGSDRDHRIIENTAEELRVLLEEEGAQLSAADWPLYMPAMNGPHRMRVVWDGLVQRGYAEDQVEKIMGRNLYRVYEDVIG